MRTTSSLAEQVERGASVDEPGSSQPAAGPPESTAPATTTVGSETTDALEPTARPEPTVVPPESTVVLERPIEETVRGAEVGPTQVPARRLLVSVVVALELLWVALFVPFELGLLLGALVLVYTALAIVPALVSLVATAIVDRRR